MPFSLSLSLSARGRLLNSPIPEDRAGGRTAVIVANVPNCYTLLRRLLKVPGFTLFGTYISLRRKPSPTSERRPPYALARLSGTVSGRCPLRTESTEHITGPDKGLQIWQHTQVAVEEERADGPLAMPEPGVYGPPAGAVLTMATGPRPVDPYP
ncbi:hypothetical protein BO71DRAFT_434258 [Aspergillus ellipticus CBS 707.79]|uniref:Uncharacterized protein n=1 Tax=Aspergillus ellipticus CBS 707.79 TaxID=1448320 RepID=A0A319CZ86_9EURO|nr:hypothetical protein BO71DRAFT_434258 [Aspergillus ellipticus CBS 707.79]